MTDDRMALIEAFQKADDGNFLRCLAETDKTIHWSVGVVLMLAG